jgi:hypothetical protein
MQPSFLLFGPFLKESHKCAPFRKISKKKKMDPDLGVMDCGAELTRHDALDLGAEMVQFLVSVCERGVRRGQGLDALICGAELPFITRALFPAEPYSVFLYLLPPVPPLLRRHISISKF